MVQALGNGRMSEPMPVKLSVNLNKVALLRSQRDVGYPSVVDAAPLEPMASAVEPGNTPGTPSAQSPNSVA